MYPFFVHTPAFDANWANIGLDDAALQVLQVVIGSDPEAGDVIPGTGGLRKIRHAGRDGGKRGGCRVCYASFPTAGVILLVEVYAKSEKIDLTPAEKRAIKKKLERFANALEEG